MNQWHDCNFREPGQNGVVLIYSLVSAHWSKDGAKHNLNSGKALRSNSILKLFFIVFIQQIPENPHEHFFNQNQQIIHG